MEENFSNIISLKDAEGNDVNFEFLDLIEYEGGEYVVLMEIDASEENQDSVVILRVEPTENEDEEAYVGVDDEEILDAVFNIFRDKFQSVFQFEDIEEDIDSEEDR